MTMLFPKYRLLGRLSAVPVLLLFAGCSLLKVSVSTGDPLPPAEVRLRALTRAFYGEVVSEVARAADSVIARSTDPAVRIGAVRWKLRAARAGIDAVMQRDAEVAMADVWILCRRMRLAFDAPDTTLFGPATAVARDAAAGLDRRVAALARDALPAGRFDLMRRFVDGYVAAHPGGGAEPAGSQLAWIEYLRAQGMEPSYATGTIAEVLADVNERVSGRTQQLSDAVTWSKDLVEMRLQQDDLREELGARLDSLDRAFTRLVVVAEHVPEISDALLAGLDREVSAMLDRVDASVDGAVAGVERQREALERYVSREREALVEQLRSSADEVVAAALAALPGMVGRVLLYLVAALVVVVGGPFALGFWLGRRHRKA